MVKFRFQRCDCKVTHLETPQLHKALIYQAGPCTDLAAASWFTNLKGTRRLPFYCSFRQIHLKWVAGRDGSLVLFPAPV